MQFPLLFNECACLKSLNKAYNPGNRPDGSPFLQYYGYGQIDGFRWLAMQKCGKNLNDLKAQEPLKKFRYGNLVIFWYKKNLKQNKFCKEQKKIFFLEFLSFSGIFSIFSKLYKFFLVRKKYFLCKKFFSHILIFKK